MKCYFFGTFNPIHKGHLDIARQIKEQYGFEAVIFVPAYCPPHKDTGNITPEDRLKMVRLAAGRKNVTDAEFFLPIPSYSYRTVTELKKKDKTDKINFIIGYDAFSKIESWSHPETLKQNVNFIVIPRRFRGSDNSFEHLKKRGWNFKIANIDFIDVSSNMIRNKIKNSQDISGLVDEKTQGYIYEHGLYKREAQKLPQ